MSKRHKWKPRVVPHRAQLSTILEKAVENCLQDLQQDNYQMRDVQVTDAAFQHLQQAGWVDPRRALLPGGMQTVVFDESAVRIFQEAVDRDQRYTSISDLLLSYPITFLAAMLVEDDD